MHAQPPFEPTTGNIDMQAYAEVYTQLTLTNSGYIAGDGVGVVTVRGKPAERNIWLLDAQTMSVEQITMSL